jgi:hypothetical protein
VTARPPRHDSFIIFVFLLSTAPRQDKSNEDDPLDAGVRTGGSNFGSDEAAVGGGKPAARAGGGPTGKPVVASMGGAHHPDLSSVASKRPGAGASSMMTKVRTAAAPRPSGVSSLPDAAASTAPCLVRGSGHLSECLEQAGGGAAPKRSALMTMVDVIERVRATPLRKSDFDALGAPAVASHRLAAPDAL